MSAVSLQPIYDGIVNPLIQTLLEGGALAIGGWATYLVRQYAPKFLQSWLEQKASKDLNTALANGVAIAMNKIQGAENVHTDIEIKGAIQRVAVQYAIDHAAGAVDHFGLSPDQLAIKALAFVPTPPIQLSSPMPVSATVEIGTLPDIPGANKE